MPEFNPNLMANNAITEVLPKDEYTLTIFEPKAYSRKFTKDGVEQEIIGVRYPMKVADGVHVGKRVFPEFSLNSDAGLGAFIRFLMAALGFEPTAEGEKKFKEQYGAVDYKLDPDSGHLGDAYRLVTGKAVHCILDSRTTDGKEYQSFKTWRRTNG